MTVLVVTDSAASLPVEEAARLGVVVVPTALVLGGLVYRDGELGTEDVVTRAARETVSTSAPSPGDFLKAIAPALSGADPATQLLVLTVSSRMSASFEVARMAASCVQEAEVRVVDTGTAAGAHGLVALAAAELAAAGAKLDEVTDRARRVADRVRLIGSLRSLDHLASSGRVPQAAAWAGRSLGAQAMFEFRAGGARPLRPARSERAGLQRMVAYVVDSQPTPSNHSSVFLRGAVLQAQATASASRLHELVREWIPTAQVFESPFSSVMIAHTGPGLVGLAWWWGPVEEAVA